MRHILIISLLGLFIIGCTTKPKPELVDQLMPVGGNWADMYDANDLEVAQTYNIAILRAVVQGNLNKIRQIDSLLEKWSIRDFNDVEAPK